MESIGLEKSSVMQSAQARRIMEFDGVHIALGNRTMHLGEGIHVMCIVQCNVFHASAPTQCSLFQTSDQYHAIT